ncbi:hypothetical protein C5167_049659 [Papaver somniferum]|uniref:Replication factor A C-terminal domain-containing protein n=1 Tax=Papaver somniferum TaxID=3469 RepID=A0A4Y7KLE5_PAPSO|nr:hypothetical protein C5167_049659 [Papaver somniferum]
MHIHKMLFPVLWSTLKINLWVLLLIRSNDPVDAESNPGPVLIAACSTFVKNYQGDCTVSATYTTKYADIYIPEQYHVQHIRTHKRMKLIMEVEDSTGTATFVAMGKAAEDLLQCSVSTLMEVNRGYFCKSKLIVIDSLTSGEIAVTALSYKVPTNKMERTFATNHLMKNRIAGTVVKEAIVNKKLLLKVRDWSWILAPWHHCTDKKVRHII